MRSRKHAFLTNKIKNLSTREPLGQGLVAPPRAVMPR